MSISSPLSLPKPSVKSVTQLLPNRLPGALDRYQHVVRCGQAQNTRSVRRHPLAAGRLVSFF